MTNPFNTQTTGHFPATDQVLTAEHEQQVIFLLQTSHVSRPNLPDSLIAARWPSNNSDMCIAPAESPTKHEQLLHKPALQEHVGVKKQQLTSDTMMSISRRSFLSVVMSWSGSRWIPTQQPLTKILVVLKIATLTHQPAHFWYIYTSVNHVCTFLKAYLDTAHIIMPPNSLSRDNCLCWSKNKTCYSSFKKDQNTQKVKKNADANLTM